MELLLLHAREQEPVAALERSESSRWLILLVAARVDMTRRIIRVRAEAEKVVKRLAHLWSSIDARVKTRPGVRTASVPS